MIVLSYVSNKKLVTHIYYSENHGGYTSKKTRSGAHFLVNVAINHVESRFAFFIAYGKELI